MAHVIRQLPDEVKSYIRSGVAITSITQCVEELLLNAFDAGSTSVAVRVDVGGFKVQVVDNGHGIPAEQLLLIGNRYATSKCHTVSDLEDLRYFGYRGEALASIKDACGILEIVTRTKTCSKALCKLFQDGKALPIKESAIPRPSVGTTITVHALFMNFPVRQKSLNESLELEKIRQRVTALSLMKPNVSVRLRNDANGVTIIHTQRCSSVLKTFGSLFGKSKAQALVEVKGMKSQFLIDGFIGREGSTKKDIQFVYINGRLVLKTKIHKIMNQVIQKSTICKKKFDLSTVSPVLPNDKDVLRKSPGKQSDKHPMFIINVKCPLMEYDITFDPAKTLVEFKDWETLLQCITDVTNDFMMREKISSSRTDDESAQFNSAVDDKTKHVVEISPSNMRDALISKTAKRVVKKTCVNIETPLGIPLDKWKVLDTYPPTSDSTCSTSSGSVIDDKSAEDDGTSSLDSAKLDNDSCSRKPWDKTSKRIFNHALKDENRQDLENKCEKQVDLNSNCCESNIQASCESAIYEDPLIVNVKNVIAQPGCSYEDSLSRYKRYAGKDSNITKTNISYRTNIDDNLIRISKMLPLNKSTENRTLSSLQKVQKFAMKKFSHKVPYTGYETEKHVLPAKFNKINVVPRLIPWQSSNIDTISANNCKTTGNNLSGADCKSSAKAQTKVTEQQHMRTSDGDQRFQKINESLSHRCKEDSKSDRKRLGGDAGENNLKLIKIQSDDRTGYYAASSIRNNVNAESSYKDTNSSRNFLSNQFQTIQSGPSALLPSINNADMTSLHTDFTNHVDANMNTNAEMGLCSMNSKNVTVKSNSDMDRNPNNIRGSQLFKNLPDIDLKDSLQSNCDDEEMFTAVPLDTHKVLQGLVNDGMKIMDQFSSTTSTQEFKPESKDRETKEKQVLPSSNERSQGNECETTGITAVTCLQLDTTQEFTPCLMDEGQIIEMSGQGLIPESFHSEENKGQSEDSQSSPASLGFTPMIDDCCSPLTSSFSKSEVTEDSALRHSTNSLTEYKSQNENANPDISAKAELNSNIAYAFKDINDDEIMNCNAETSMLSQDTLEMPSVLECSIQDKSVEIFQVKNDLGKNTIDSQDNDTGEITVTQLLLNIKETLTPSNDTYKTIADALTFRDIFTPTQSQLVRTDTSSQNSGYFCENKHTLLNKNTAERKAILEHETFNKVNEDEEHTRKEGVVMSIEKGECAEMDMSTSGTEDGVDEFSENRDNNWIQMLHPDTGKKMFVHSKLGTVVDNIYIIGKEKNAKTENGVIKTPMTVKPSLQQKTESSVRPRKTESHLSKPSSSSLQKMLCHHLEMQEDETEVKWRKKPEESSGSTETSSVAELFSEWENPVFSCINKSVMNIETGTITNKSSIKAMKTLHTCTFTKDMLKTVQVVGQLDKKFIACLIQTDLSSSGPDLLAVIDQHAAHERVRLELLTEEAYEDGNIEKGKLAKFSVNAGKPIKIDPDEIQVMMSFRDEFSRIGITFRLDTHSDDIIKVLSVPECLIDKEAAGVEKKMESIYWDTIQTLIKGHVELLLKTEGAKGRMPSIIHKLLCSQACHGAIKFGDKLSQEDCKSLIHDLSLCDLPFQCAHGRPSVMPVLALQQLETRLPQKQKQTQKPQLQKLRLAIKKQVMSDFPD